MPSKRKSSARVDYVPALCTHRPSLLPIEWSGEVFGSWRRGRFASGDVARRGWGKDGGWETRRGAAEGLIGGGELEGEGLYQL
ncbi:Multiple epidermal growth factor-like domains protein 8 [Actinidia chinensis var. chinensis]|uniref:Multiple epidermal growth factor-like domains protein 8 n=1 Tax=Actinidia chinensis var. chinensis TaxID=1590841 RepID=A0A2R6QFN2_ACTCC|nr:Multiple epidermal growth factor-like domains protein 8 [Actinidia chinensis var. chinensis]